MTTQEKRLMITGTEGQPDYLVVARRNGYVLGIKPLLQCSMDQSVFGFRLRLQKAATGQDIANKQLDAEGMTKVFTQIPWHKRSSKRFSTVITSTLSWGVEFTPKILEVITQELGGMLDEVGKCFEDGEEWIDPTDMHAFLIHSYGELAEKWRKEYEAFLAENEGTAQESGEGQIVAFPSGEADIDIE